MRNNSLIEGLGFRLDLSGRKPVVVFAGGGTRAASKVEVSLWDALTRDSDAQHEVEYGLALDGGFLEPVVGVSDEESDPLELRQWVPGSEVVYRTVTRSGWQKEVPDA